jgi:PHP family Zn ribbon phosphoesterase
LPDLPYDAVEVVSDETPAGLEKWPIVRFSDSHDPDQIARRFTEIDVESVSVAGLREALRRSFNQR